MIKEEFLTPFKRFMKMLEGVRRLPYDDQTSRPLRASKGKISIGIGRNLEANPLSDDEIHYLFFNDVKRAISDCHSIFGDAFFESLSLNRRIALASMAFQMGGKSLSGFVDMIPAVLSEQWEDAARHALDSKWANVDAPNRAPVVARLFTQETLL